MIMDEAAFWSTEASPASRRSWIKSHLPLLLLLMSSSLFAVSIIRQD